MSKKLASLAVLALLLLNASFASAEESFANLHKGNFLTGANFSWEKKWTVDDHASTVDLEIPAQYFVMDHFALGVLFGISHLSEEFTYSDSASLSQKYTTYEIGPAATYYFLEAQRWGFYLEQSIAYLHTSSDYDFDGDAFGGSNFAILSRSMLGANYFVTSSVAFGPSFRYSHAFRHGMTDDASNWSLVASFALSL
jgi:hypothetical protein